jgi:hypothetical protein
MSYLDNIVKLMGRLILTGLTKNKNHNFVLRYEPTDSGERCWVDCRCGFSQELLFFHNYAGIKALERVWTSHTAKKQ